MKLLKRTTVATNSVVALCSLATPSFAKTEMPTLQSKSHVVQNPSMPMMMGGWHYRSPYGNLYFSGTPVELEGTIVEYSTFVPQPRMMSGNLLVLKTDKGNRTIHLGPRWYIREQNLEIKVGDQISVHGNLVKQGTNEIIFASKISKGQQTWILRDPDGIPNWCAQRMVTPQSEPEKPTQSTPKK